MSAPDQGVLVLPGGSEHHLLAERPICCPTT